MTTLKSTKVIAESLQQIDKVFRGSFIIRGNDVLKWTLYFRLGRLSWVTGGLNSRERLQRHLAISCPQITLKTLKPLLLGYKIEQEQKILVHLQGKGLITRTQMAELMKNIAIEVLFDAIQYGEIDSENLSCHTIAEEQNNNFLLLLPFLDINVVFAEAQQKWHEWKNACLENYSPNLYPIIQQADLLPESVEDPNQQKIINSINGTRTLRGIATKNKQNIVTTALFLVSLVDSGAIIFSVFPSNKKPQAIKPEKSTLKKVMATVSESSSTQVSDLEYYLERLPKPKNSQEFLIVCIDDSPLVCKAVKDIVTEQNHHFIEIQEPIKVIPILLRNKPDLIFLDLMMPIINGYELCAQIRKTPSLKEVPIVILTGKDGLVDRMRAKLVGSTDFITKPVKTFPVLKAIDRYLVVNQP